MPRLTYLIVLLLAPLARAADAPAVDCSTLHKKVIVGYQGWFRCPGDPANEGWVHWSRDRKAITPRSLSFEMWPDLTGFDDDEKYPAGDFTYPDGRPAQLYSAANAKTVRRHFEWMRDYGIDGAFVQRFLVETRRPSTDLVLGHCRTAAIATGRAYAVCYDLSGAKPDTLYDRLTADWKRLVDELKVTGDKTYLRENGKPVCFVWGFYSDRFDAALAHRVIDFFKADGPYAATLVGGTPWPWRREKDAEWARAYRRLDVISPWNVGNVQTIDGKKYVSTAQWKDDLAEAKKAGAAYLPVIYPGFSWTNLKGPSAAKQAIPRLGGEVFWRQFNAAAGLGIDMAYVAMFDEVDEGTAIFKVSNAPPTQAAFVTLDGLPSDTYLKLTGEGTKLIRGDLKPGSPLTTFP